MKYVVKKSEARSSDEQGVSKFAEYGSPFPSFTMGVSTIDGRYPAAGFDVDEGIDASWYVAAGIGRIFIGGDVHDVTEGDMVFVPKGERFWIEGSQLKLVVTSSPPWNSVQHKHIKE